MLITGLDSSEDLCRGISDRLRTDTMLFRERSFPDGEVLVRAKNPEDLTRHDTIVFCDRMYPNQNTSIVKLVQALGIIRSYNRKAHLKLALPYLPYARQDKRFLEGEAVTLRTLLTILDAFSVHGLATVDCHAAERAREMAPFQFVDISALNQLTKTSTEDHTGESDMILVAPDEGGLARVKEVVQETGHDYVAIEKRRDRETGDVTGRIKTDPDKEYGLAVILDDIISTGGTMVLAARLLREKGIDDIVAAATHLLLLENADEKILSAGCKRIIGTNSVQTEYSKVGCEDLLAEALRIL